MSNQIKSMILLMDIHEPQWHWYKHILLV